jgi:hypothetical protein
VKDMVSKCSAICFVAFNGFCQLASADDNFSEDIEDVAAVRFRREVSADLPQSQLLGSNLESSSSLLKSALVVLSLVALCVGCLMLAAWRYHPSSVASLRNLVSAVIRRRRGASSLAFGPPVHRQSYSAAGDAAASSWAERLFRTQNEPLGSVQPLSFVDSQIDVLQTSVNLLHTVDAVTLDDRYRPLQLM